MTWRQFIECIGGLSAESRTHHALHAETAATPVEEPMLEGAAAERALFGVLAGMTG